MRRRASFLHQVAPSIDDAEVERVGAYLRSGGWLTEFRETEEFERLLAEQVGARYCSVVSNGTVTLFLALAALEIGAGDEVIVPDLTMIATPNAVRLAGARPVLADVDARTLCLTAGTIEAKRTSRTRAVMLVSLNGRFPSDIADIQTLCDRHGIALIEDAAQSLGSTFGDRPIGTFGRLGSYSFSPHKIVTTGQGGAVVTNDEGLHRAIERLKDFGRDVPGRDDHPFLGWNFKFTDIQAVIGIEQMKKLDARIRRKRAIFERYRRGLSQVQGVTFLPTDLTQATPWFVDVFVEDPTDLANALKEANVGSRPIYPPIHAQPIYTGPAGAGSGAFPATTVACARGLWLPSSVDLTDEDVDFVCDCVREHLAGRAPA
jgi:perosamine synthetase